jgi:hypothetical protein
MKLQPISTQDLPAYPGKKWRIVAGIRRVVAIAAVSAAASLGGCAAPAQEAFVAPVVSETPRLKQSASPGSRSLEWCQDVPRLSGDRSPAYHFTCGPVQVDSLPVHDAPPWVADGQLCGAETAWARYRVASPTRVMIQLTSTTMKLALIAPDGSRVAELGPQRPCLALDMEAGVWTLAATPTPGAPNPLSYFELFFEHARGTP